MAYKDGGVFQTYCDKPYDRHTYKLVLTTGKEVVHEDYDILRSLWFQRSSLCSHIEVVDK